MMVALAIPPPLHLSAARIGRSRSSWPDRLRCLWLRPAQLTRTPDVGWTLSLCGPWAAPTPCPRLPVDAHQAFTGPGRVLAKIIGKFESSNDANAQTR